MGTLPNPLSTFAGVFISFWLVRDSRSISSVRNTRIFSYTPRTNSFLDGSAERESPSPSNDCLRLDTGVDSRDSNGLVRLLVSSIFEPVITGFGDCCSERNKLRDSSCSCSC